MATLAVAGCGGSGISKPNPDDLAQTISATSCTDSGYYLQNRLDKTKAELFNCVKNGNEICVTEEGGIPRNVTAEAKIVFGDTLGDATKPECVSG